MAKYATGSAASADALWVANDTHILANGWSTLYTHANSSGDRDRTYIGGAIDATAGNKPIVRVTHNNAAQANTIGVRAYTDFDSSAGAGFNVAGGTLGIDPCAITVQASSFTYYLRANKFAFVIGGNPIAGGNNPCFLYAGYLRRNLPYRWSGVTKSTGSIASGNTVINVASDMRARMYVGQKILLINHAGNNASANKSRAVMKTISAIGASSITLTATAGAAYDAGTLIGENPNPICLMSFYGGQSAQSSATTYHCLYLDGTRGAGATTQTANLVNLPRGSLTQDQPGISNRFRWVDIGVEDATAAKTGFRGVLHHLHGCTPRASGMTAPTDIVDDLVNTFLVAGHDTSFGGTLLGPR